MYFVIITLLMLVLPVASILVEFLASGTALLPLIGKWFVFWAGGIRLFMAGLRQFFTPEFTAETIFETKDEGAQKVVTELGMGNMALGAIGIASLWFPAWIMPAAVAAAIFFGLAGVKHVANKGKNRLEMFATVSDLWAALVFALFIIGTALAAG
jgi:hypothetical protein